MKVDRPSWSSERASVRRVRRVAFQLEDDSVGVLGGSTRWPQREFALRVRSVPRQGAA